MKYFLEVTMISTSCNIANELHASNLPVNFCVFVILTEAAVRRYSVRGCCL